MIIITTEGKSQDFPSRRVNNNKCRKDIGIGLETSDSTNLFIKTKTLMYRFISKTQIAGVSKPSDFTDC